MPSSIHVPASTVQKIYAVAKWIMPIVGTSLLGALGLGWGWVMNRTSVDEVAPKIAEVGIAAKAAQASALHCEMVASTARDLAKENARLLLQLWGQAEVIRAYGRSPNLPTYIERARKYYLSAFEDHLDRDPADPLGALRKTQRLTWRPDRSD